MHEFASFNKRILKATENLIPAVSNAALYGRGAFTTLAIYNRKPFLWNEHWRRIREHAEKLSIDLSKIDGVEESLIELIELNKIENGRARITLFDIGGSMIWNFASSQKTAVLITTAERNETPQNLRLNISKFLVNSTSPLAGLKTCNYLENLLALESAKKSGFNEAVRLNEKGEIVSACFANLFWIKDKQIYTPSLKTGSLAGTTRNLIFKFAKNLNFSIFEVDFQVNALEMADEAFLTSAGIGICEIANIETKNYRSEITAEFQKVYSDLINRT